MGWELFGWSFSVVRKHAQLILFPILSAAATMACLYVGWLTRQGIARHLELRDLLWAAPAYLLASFAMVFFNCALAACAQAYFAGDEPTLGYGFRHAAARFVPILAWSILSATVGLILNFIERRVSIAGKVAAWLFGFAWAMATYLVVPVLIAEDRGAFGSVGRSAQLLRETWGDQLVAQIRFGWRALLFFIPCLIVGVIGANGYPILLPLAAALFIAGTAVLSAARGIFEVALYRYAALKETPAGWTPGMLSIIHPPNSTRILDI